MQTIEDGYNTPPKLDSCLRCKMRGKQRGHILNINY
jgi:hypothetical protein